MIKKPKLLRSLEDKLLKKEKLNLKDSLRLFEEMWKEALALKVFPLKNPLEGIEVDLKMAKILNSCLKSS